MDTTLATIQPDADFLTRWSAQATQSQFEWDFELQKTDADFTVTHGQAIIGDTAKDYYWIDPRSIAAATPPGYPISVLLYDAALYPTTISIESPTTINGATFAALPISPESNPQGRRQNISHELCHVEYYLVNQSGANFKDDVHTHGGYDDPRPQANYADILLKLKPYWPILAGATTDKNTLLQSLQLKAISLLQRLVQKLQAQIQSQKKTQ